METVIFSNGIQICWITVRSFIFTFLHPPPPSKDDFSTHNLLPNIKIDRTQIFSTDIFVTVNIAVVINFINLNFSKNEKY